MTPRGNKVPRHLCVFSGEGGRQAVHRYQRLGALLRGEAPRALLQAVPRGYVAARARALAEGPCLAAFRWASGGAWGGKPWSVELPTDSALLLYLFAAFLEARRSARPCLRKTLAGARRGCTTIEQ